MLTCLRRTSASLVVLTLFSASFPVHAQPVEAAAAPAEQPADRVQLRNGGMVQGSILEVLPNDSLTIVSAATGDRKTFSWSEIAAYEQGGQRVELGAVASPAPVAREEPAPQVYGPRLHIETTKPANVQLYEITGEMIAHGANVTVHGISYRSVCSAPCGSVIDTSRGSSFFFGGDGLTTSNRFNLADARGDVTATVKPGRRGLRIGGIVTMSVGISLMAVGGAMILIANNNAKRDAIFDDKPREDPKYGAPVGVIVAGAAALAGGIAMLVLGKTRFKLKTGGLGVFRPLRFG
ncbi:hypothetical protein [Nannocystis punicea]|uniref:Uncharacterized protein n=1 Tax=Nannocystis punicea TaxID=2995304 RepID=A0ABY7H9K8_9BACT|nr:hypothetical protein [Nannocystis poenicansa]WAS95780.1 hypothetical protein O0S08_06420 [Nannocystis poenicansa]